MNISGLSQGRFYFSHGQASVERGFSVNKEIMLENCMLEHTLKAQRTISDHIKSVGGALNVKITKEFVLHVSASMSRQMYSAYLDEVQKKKEGSKKGEKRKMTYDELEELKSKKKAMERNRDALVKSADEFADKAESTSNLEYIFKSNALRCGGKEKDNEIVAINEQISTKLQELKSLKINISSMQLNFVSLPCVSVHYLQNLLLLICKEVYIT